MATKWRTLIAVSVILLMALTGCGTAAPGTATGGALPDNRTIDTFSYSFSPAVIESPGAKVPIFGPAAGLSITREGNVRYNYASEPHTGSGGQTVVKEWDIPTAEATSVLDGLVADGLLDLEGGTSGKGHAFTVAYGRWQLTCMPATMPERMIARFRPYLDKGHADLKTKAP